MILTTEAQIIEIKEYRVHGNDFRVTPVLLNINDKPYEVQAIGNEWDICNGLNAGDVVKCEMFWRSVQSKTDPNKYWNNINLIKIESVNEQLTITPQEASVHAQSFKEEKKEDDLPF